MLFVTSVIVPNDQWLKSTIVKHYINTQCSWVLAIIACLVVK